MFSSGGSPTILSVLKGNLTLVAGRVVLQTDMGLCRSVPGSFSFDFVFSLPSNLAKVPTDHFSLLQSLISSVYLSFSTAFAGFPSHAAFYFLRFSSGLMLFSPEGIKICLVDNVIESGEFVLQSALPDELVQL